MPSIFRVGDAVILKTWEELKELPPLIRPSTYQKPFVEEYQGNKAEIMGVERVAGSWVLNIKFEGEIRELSMRWATPEWYRKAETRYDY